MLTFEAAEAMLFPQSEKGSIRRLADMNELTTLLSILYTGIYVRVGSC